MLDLLVEDNALEDALDVLDGARVPPYYTVVALLLHCYYIGIKRVRPWCPTVVTLLLHHTTHHHQLQFT
jgi:hypothetical protein